MYCQEPEQGDATTFIQANVYMRPKKYTAVFFSYNGPDNIMDEAYTEHFGCPVLRGEKITAILWIREGVSKEAPGWKYDLRGEVKLH